MQLRRLWPCLTLAQVSGLSDCADDPRPKMGGRLTPHCSMPLLLVPADDEPAASQQSDDASASLPADAQVYFEQEYVIRNEVREPRLYPLYSFHHQHRVTPSTRYIHVLRSRCRAV